jgi:transcriptional regulator with XRE-family HTH domain
MISSAQCRAARAILRWSVKELAEKAHLSPNTVVRFENEVGSSNATTQVMLQQAFETAGVRFTGGGVLPPDSGE